MKVRTSELSGVALDWAVAMCEYWRHNNPNIPGAMEWFHLTQPSYILKGTTLFDDTDEDNPYEYHLGGGYSTAWAQAGPIIEREGITLERFKDTSYWSAFNFRTGDCEIRCESPLLAAMRCYVASKLGGVVEVPDELIIDL